MDFMRKDAIFILLLVTIVGSLDGSVLARPDGDLCKWMNGRKYFIGVGETSTISVGNVTSQLSPNNDTWSPRMPQRCSVELITCPSCHFQVTVDYLNIPTCSSNGKCRCDYIWLKEPTISRLSEELCGVKRNDSRMVFESMRKLLSLDFLYSYSYADAFSLQVTAKSNVYVLKGQADFYQGASTGYIVSPHFPLPYPSDYSVEYQLVNTDPRGFVQLVFTDFQLSPWSYIEVLDTNGTRIDVYNGNTFRPPIVVSSGVNLTVKFRANDEYANAGFRAKYTFVNYPEKYWLNKPSTDCGGIVDDSGGAITMMNMVAQTGTPKSYDCIWLVKSSAREASESQISIRVAQFDEMGAQSALEIKQGLTSASYPLITLNSQQQPKNQQHAQEYIIPATSGYYIRLKGSFTNRSRLAVVYSVFSFDSACNETNQFMCANGRCLHPSIHCDGFNHCGDGSDELGCDGKVIFEKRLTEEKKQSRDTPQWWTNLTPNYYFPKPESSELNNGTSTLILLTSLAGLGMFILTTILILIKLRKQRQLEALNREALRSISEFGDGRRIYPGEMPLFDPPPTYDDVIKFYMPPPPAYSTIDDNSPTLSRFNSGTLPGVENAAFTMVSESPPPTYREATHKNSRILRVILPSSSAERRHHRRQKGSPAKARSAHRRTAHQRARRNLEASLVAAFLLEDRRKPCQCQGACSCPSVATSPPQYQDTRPRPRPTLRPPSSHHVSQSSSTSTSGGIVTSFASTIPESIVPRAKDFGPKQVGAQKEFQRSEETAGPSRVLKAVTKPRSRQSHSAPVTPVANLSKTAVSKDDNKRDNNEKRRSPKRAPIMPLNSRLLAFELDRITAAGDNVAGAPLSHGVGVGVMQSGN